MCHLVGIEPMTFYAEATRHLSKAATELAHRPSAGRPKIEICQRATGVDHVTGGRNRRRLITRRLSLSDERQRPPGAVTQPHSAIASEPTRSWRTACNPRHAARETPEQTVPRYT
ncbi:unnamed protein product, partial [Iphiclides podalirius]